MGVPIRRFDHNDRPLPLSTPAPLITSPRAPSPSPTPEMTPTTSTPALPPASHELWNAPPLRMTHPTPTPALSSATHELWNAPPWRMTHLAPPHTPSQHLIEPAHLPPRPSTARDNRHPHGMRATNNAGSQEGPAPPAVTSRYMGRSPPALMRQIQAAAGVLQAMVGEERAEPEEERAEPEVERSVESDSNAE